MYRSRQDLAARQMSLLQSSMTADMEISLDDGRIIPVHRAILAAASEPFRVLLGLELDASAALFATGARNVMRGALYRPGTADHRPRLSLTGVPLHAVAALLRFVYTGTVALARHTTTDILFLSEKFSIAALRSLCELYMPRVLREENACSVLTSAVDARAAGLVAYCTAYILRHFDGVIESPGFLKLPRALVASLLAHDDLCVVNEERLFKAILRWGLANIPITSQAYANQPQRAMDSGFTSGASAMAVTNREEIVGGLLSGISFTSGTLPIIPSTSVPALKALLAELCPVLRFAHLDVPVLKSPAVGAIVASDITLTALFEKISLDQSVAAAEQNRLTSALSLEQHQQQQQGDAAHTNTSVALQSALAASSFELGTGMGGTSMSRQGGGTSAAAAGMLAGSRQAMAQAVLSPHLHQQALQHGQSMASSSSQSGMLGSYSVSGGSVGPSRPTIIGSDLLFETGLALSMSLGTDLVAGASMSSTAHSSAGLAGGYSGLLRQQSAAAAYVSDRRTTDIPLPASVTQSTAALEDAQANYAPPTVQSLVSGGMDAASATAILTAGNSSSGTGGGALTGMHAGGHSSTLSSRGASLGMFGMASSGRAADGSSKRRRYGDLRSNPFLAARVPTSVPCRVGFEPHHSPEVATSNGGRTLALPASATHAGAAGRGSATSRGAHASSGRAQLGNGDVRRLGPDNDSQHSSEYPLPGRPVKGLGPLNGCEGDQGATIVAAQPSVAVPPVLHASDRDPGLSRVNAAYLPDRDPAVTGPTATLLPPGRVAWEMCIEDSAALLDIDPEGSDYADADVRATARSLDMGLILPTQASRGVLGAEAGTSSQQGTAFSTAVVPGFPAGGPMGVYGGMPGGGYGGYPMPYGVQGGMMYHHPQQGYPMPMQSPYGMVMPPAGLQANAPALAPQLLPEHLIRPFEVAICLLPSGAVSVAAATGKLRSGHPADHDVLWMVTNRGYVYSRVPSTAPAPSPPVPVPDGVPSSEAAVPLSQPAKDTGDAPTAAAPDSAAPSTSSSGRGETAKAGKMIGTAVGPLTLIASGCPFAVGSYVHVAVNTITGDVGVSISNVRAGFSQDEEDEEVELAGLDSSSTSGLSGASGMDPVLEAAFGHVASSAGARRRRARTARLLHGLDGLLPVSDVVPPRPPPPAFTLLSTGSVPGILADAAPKVLHTADPSVSSRATLHACVYRVPLAAALYSTGMAQGLRPHTRGVQLALMARSPQGLVVTLIPPGDQAA